jgi:8-oxo-dGTP diphosphatase
MLEVTAAVMIKNDNVLICQRAKDDDAPLMWEFPGGKLETGETPEQCIIREIKEELDLDIRVTGILAEADYYYNRHVHFTFFAAEITGGIMKLNVHDDAKWVFINTLTDYDFFPADLSVVDMLIRNFKAEAIPEQ